MSTFARPWCLCGGWAIDAWLGKQTRDHLDVDICVFIEDQRALFEHLAGWNLVAHDAETEDALQANPGATRPSDELWDGRQLKLPAHIHARPPGEANLAALMRWVTPPHTADRDGLDFDIIFNEGAAAAWVLHDSPRVAMPFARAARMSPQGVAMAAPEVLAFFKASAYAGLPGYPRKHDLADFKALAPALSAEGREWLRTSITALPHPWLAHLEE
jgi:hypothetical protein